MAQQSRRPARRLAVVRFALWLALMTASAGVALLVGVACGLIAGVGAGLIAAGLSSAALLYFVVDIDSPDGGTPR